MRELTMRKSWKPPFRQIFIKKLRIVVLVVKIPNKNNFLVEASGFKVLLKYLNTGKEQ